MNGIRRWLPLLLTIAFAWVLLSRLTEAETLAQTLVQGQWFWLLIAMLLQSFYFIAYAGSYWCAFDIVGVANSLRRIIPLTFVALFVNTSAPSGGAAGAALFIDDAGRRGQSVPRAAMGVLLQTAVDFSAFCIILVAGLVVLATRRALQWYEVVAASVLMVYVIWMAGALLLGKWRPQWLSALLIKLQAILNRLAAWMKLRARLPAGWSERNANQLIEASHSITAHPRKIALTLLVAAVAHAFDIATLYAVFRAFRQPVGLDVLIAGYAMITLFWIVSPTPNGAGIVEGVLPIVFVTLGIPAAAAALVTLTFRGISLWLPVLAGFALFRYVPGLSSPQPTKSHHKRVNLAAIAVAVMGMINVLSGATPSLRDRVALLAELSPTAVRASGHLAAVFSGFALLLLAQGLWRYKRTAWLLTEIVLLLSIVAHMLKGLDYEEAILAGLLAAYLWSQRRHYNALSDPPSLRQGIATLLLAFFFTLGYGIAGFYLLDRHFSVDFGLAAAARQTTLMFIAFSDPGLAPLTGFGRYFAASIYIVAAVTFAYALLMLLRPVIQRGPAGPAERRQAQTIVQAYGRSSLACFVTFPDKAYWFSTGGSAVAYAVHRRMAVVLGDPIGPAEDVAAAIVGFRAFCLRNDWDSAYYQTLPDHLEAYRAAGYAVLCIGHEGIVDLRTFTLSGGENKHLRTNVNHFTKAGFRAVVYEPPLSSEMLAALRAISDEWLASVHGKEKHFSLGWFDDEYIGACLVMTVVRPDGSISAFTNLTSEYQRNEATADLMRHREDAEPGTMDFLFVSLLQWSKEQGYASFNLGLSALAGIGETPGDPVAERALHYIYEHISQFYNFKGLHEFKQKYHPHWEPRYLVFSGYAALPAVGYALESASSGSNFLLAYAADAWRSLRESRRNHGEHLP